MSPSESQLNRQIREIDRRVGEVLAAAGGLARAPWEPDAAGKRALSAPTSNRDLARFIDHTLLKPEARASAIEQLCHDALRLGVHAVCVNPVWVELCARLLQGSGVRVATVVGFPLGATLTRLKGLEAAEAVRLGAAELDMVLNIGWLKDGAWAAVRGDMEAVVEAAGGAAVKVILETVLLTDEEKIAACLLARAAGVDFVKTSTGLASGGATVRDVRLMRRVIGARMGVKAAGGIRDAAGACAMLAAGASRIGTSNSVAIVTE